MKTALVYFTEISKTVGHIGGSEILLFLIVKDLQKRGYVVTVALQEGGDIGSGARDYGVAIDDDSIHTVYLSECGRWLRWLNRHLKFLWMWRLRRMGQNFDLCISCANPVDFGRPGIHFIYMLTLDEKFKAYFWRDCQGWRKLTRNRLVFMRDSLVAFLVGVRMPSKIVRDVKEVVLANSNYAKACVETYYKCQIHDAFYPPTVFEPVNTNDAKPDNCNIAYIGRFEPEKRVDVLVEIVRIAREKSGIDFRLNLAGKCPDTEDGNRIRNLVSGYSWVKLEGTVSGKKKAEFLASCRFALHGCKVEAFGISVTEYIKSGLVPIVPREGGSSEVVGLSDLVYGDNDGAANILVRLAQDEAFYCKCAMHCQERARHFSAAAYAERQTRLLDELGV